MGKMSPCTSDSYGLNGIGTRRGAQYKVYSTIYNILGRVSLIRHTRVGLNFFGHLTPREASAVSRSTAIATAATPQHLSHMYVRISACTQADSH